MKKVKITWICQGGFIFDDGKTRVVIDPYLSNSLYFNGLGRMATVPIAFEDLKPDIVIFTHDHADHYNEETVAPIAKHYPKCKFAGPTSTFNHFEKMGFNTELFTIINVGQNLKFGDVNIVATKAYHTEKFAIGALISIADKLIYISGDSLYEKDLSQRIKKLQGNKKIDTAIVCINGKWGNMTDEDAVKLMSELKPERAIPMHYGLFAKNTASPKNFIEKVRLLGIKCDELTAGKEYIF